MLLRSSRNSGRDTVSSFLSTSHTCVHCSTGHPWPPSPSWESSSWFSSLPDSALVLSLGPKWLSVARIPLRPFPVFPLILRTNVQHFPRPRAAPDSPLGLALPCYPAPPLHTPRPPPEAPTGPHIPCSSAVWAWNVLFPLYPPRESLYIF